MPHACLILEIQTLLLIQKKLGSIENTHVYNIYNLLRVLIDSVEVTILPGTAGDVQELPALRVVTVDIRMC